MRARVRLDVRVLGAEELLRAVDRELLDLVDDLAAAVVAAAGIALRVLVRRGGADRLEHRRPREVLRRDELDLPALALELFREESRDVGVDLVEPGVLQLLERLLGRGHISDATGRRGRHTVVMNALRIAVVAAVGVRRSCAATQRSLPRSRADRRPRRSSASSSTSTGECRRIKSSSTGSGRRTAALHVDASGHHDAGRRRQRPRRARRACSPATQRLHIGMSFARAPLQVRLLRRRHREPARDRPLEERRRRRKPQRTACSGAACPGKLARQRAGSVSAEGTEHGIFENQFQVVVRGAEWRPCSAAGPVHGPGNGAPRCATT